MTPTAIDGELAPPARSDLLGLLESLHELVEVARSMPLSNSAIVNREEVLGLLSEVVDRLPEEVRQARWLLKEREEFLARAHRDAEEIMAAARSRAEGMVQRTEVVREAHRLARITVEQAEAEARRIRNQAEEYVDTKLAGFEVTLERALAAVQKGRRRLTALPASPASEPPPPAFTLFDQDA